MANKQDKLQRTVLLESYTLLAIIETWWDKSCDWSAALNDYGLFKKGQVRKEG